MSTQNEAHGDEDQHKGKMNMISLSDWYEDGEAQLTAVLADHAPFDLEWYFSKKEIASAHIWSETGVKIKVEVSVLDDFGIEGLGYASTDDWTIDSVQACITRAWRNAQRDRDENQESWRLKCACI